MRVIGGSARGRRLEAPDIASVRPTADRVREAIFDVLMHLDVVRGATVVDLFAGSGALGIEALSRGAASVTFVESNPRVLATIEANLARLGFDAPGSARVLRRDAISWCRSNEQRFDLALCDPPYDFAQWDALFSELDAALVVCESSGPIELPESLVLYRVYRYGTTLVTVATSPDRMNAETRT